MQQRNQGWKPFTRDEIQAFYGKKFKENFCFNRLIEPQMIPPNLARAWAGHRDPLIPQGGGWIIESGDKYYVTHDFIARCYKSRPQKV